MKKILFIVACFILCATTTFASMNIVTPAQTGIDHYFVTGLGAAVTNPVQAQPDGSLLINVSTIPTGTYTITTQPCTSWDDCATPSTLNFSRVLPNASTPSLVKK